MLFSELLEGNKALYKPCSKFDGAFTERRAAFLCGGEASSQSSQSSSSSEMGLAGQFVYVRDDREEEEDHFGLCEVEVFRAEKSLPCGQPEQPASSQVFEESSSDGTRSATFSCMKGFRMEGGDETRMCLPSGLWSGSAPRCAEVQCDHPRSVKDGFIEVSNFRGKYVFGSLATYHCNPGYVLWGNASRLCGDRGTWSGKCNLAQL